MSKHPSDENLLGKAFMLSGAYGHNLTHLPKNKSFQDARQYWLERVPLLPPSPELPLISSTAARLISTTAAHPCPQYSRRSTRLEAKTWYRLQEDADREGLLASSVLLTAYAEVVSIWSKKVNFLLRVTLLDEQTEERQLFGFLGDFPSFSLLEIKNTSGKTFLERIREQQEQHHRDLDNRSFSGMRIVREISRFQRVDANAVATVAFTSLLDLGPSNDLGRLGENVGPVAHNPAYLSCTVRQDLGALVIHWDAVDALFPPGMLNDMFHAYGSFLGQLATQSTPWRRTLAENVRCLFPIRQAKLIAATNRTTAPISDELLYAPFLKQVQTRPKQTAVCTPTDRLSYAELYRRACRIEQELLDREVNPNQLIGIAMKRGWEQVVAVLGVLMAGAAYIPIDPELPAERQRYLIEDSKLRLVLTQSSLRLQLTVPEQVDLVAVDGLEGLGGIEPISRSRQNNTDLAYVIYTSGSTGQPKGVMIDHRGALNTVLDINERFGIGPRDKVLALSRLSFDLSVYDIFGMLAAGGTIVMPAAELSPDPTEWAELVVRENVTVWNTVPALASLLVDQADRYDAIGQSLRLIMLSGDWIPVSLPGLIRHRLLTNARIVSLGGATEASIWSILYPIEHLDTKWKSIPYGRPMRNQTFHVLNQEQAPCPVWVPGELYIGGIGLAQGYWCDPHKTESRFLRHKISGERLYRTGDWGRYLPDGNIEFLGREDSQVKISGYRIELGEIEAKLGEHPAVKHSAVVVRADTPGERSLVGYFTTRAGAKVAPAALQGFLRSKLPEYMVPAVFVPLQELPLTPNGKIDLKLLTHPAEVGLLEQNRTPGPSTPLEERLLPMIQETLKNDAIQADDNFFLAGGHSLLAIQLVMRVRDAFAVDLTLRHFFEAPTVKSLALVVEALIIESINSTAEEQAANEFTD